MTLEDQRVPIGDASTKATRIAPLVASAALKMGKWPLRMAFVSRNRVVLSSICAMSVGPEAMGNSHDGHG